MESLWEQRNSAIYEGLHHVLHTREAKHMIRHWIQMLVLVLVVLAQAVCPRNAAKQNLDSTVDTLGQTRERGGY